MKRVAVVGLDNHMDEISGRDPNGRPCSFPHDEHLHSLFPHSSSAAVGRARKNDPAIVFTNSLFPRTRKTVSHSSEPFGDCKSLYVCVHACVFFW